MNTNLTVFIIGTTASGKTKLSLSLSDQINYDIINCDSMQLYKDANIMTAKPSIEERNKIRHHCIDVLELENDGFNRQQYFKLAQQSVNQIQSQGIIPVFVGGTTYYMETLLFKQAAQTEQIQMDFIIDNDNPYQQLLSLDPLAAQKFHPNDRRRIKNSLQFYARTGKLPSQMPDFHGDDNELAMENFLIFWPKWKNKEDLKNKIIERINEMIYQDGGIEEIFRVFRKLEGVLDIKGGVLQSIGYRQFSNLYEAYKERNLIEIMVTSEFKQNLHECIQQLIIDTIHYTKKQIQWIKNRILCNSKIDLIKQRLFKFEFDSSKTFNEQVIIPAQIIFKSFVQNQELTYQLTAFQLSAQYLEKYQKIRESKQRANWKKEICEICNRETNGPNEKNQHLRSFQHKNSLKKYSQTQLDQIQKQIKLN